MLCIFAAALSSRRGSAWLFSGTLACGVWRPLLLFSLEQLRNNIKNNNKKKNYKLENMQDARCCVTPNILLSTQAAINSLSNRLDRFNDTCVCRDSSKTLSLSLSLSHSLSLTLSHSLTLSLSHSLSLSLFPFLPFQMLPDLKADNQRLKDENGALIRVISKLSK